MPKPRHVHEIYIRTTADRLWHALTDPTQVRQYYFGCAYDAPLEAGQPYRMVGESGAAIDGVVKEIVPNEKLAVTFHVLFDPTAAAEEPTTVTWEITQVTPETCRLSLVHQDFGGLSATWAVTLHGWRVVLDGLKSMIETGSSLGAIPDDRAGAEIQPVDLSGQEHRERGIEIYNDTWRYISMEDRNAEDDEAMIRRAYASAYHWSLAAGRTITNDARGEWILSRVHAITGRGETALHHARRCLAFTLEAGLQDFDLAYAHEALARALAALGRDDEATNELAAARAVPIGDPEDEAILVADLEAGPWFGLTPSAG